jgi:Icc-related predicted phosphoesterase
MKVLCVADHIDPLVYSTQAKKRFHDVQLVLGAGDLPLEYYSFIVSSLNVPLLFIFGNHNLSELDRYMGRSAEMQATSIEETLKGRSAVGATFLEDRHHRHGKLLIAGLGGSIRYNDGEHQFSEFQMMVRILKMVPHLWWNKLVHGRYLDILLTHAPPRGIHDRQDKPHWGFKAFLTFMKWFSPRYLIHGHIHLYELNETRRTTYLKTEVVNCYDHLVLDIENGK